MSFKLALSVGYFDPVTFDVVRPMDTSSVQQMIVQAGGRLPEEVWTDEAERQRLMVLMTAHRRWTLGYVGAEYVVLNAAGFLRLAVGYGPNPSLRAFLRLAATDGCTIWTEDGEATESVLETLAATEARWAAQRKV